MASSLSPRVLVLVCLFLGNHAPLCSSGNTSRLFPDYEHRLLQLIFNRTDFSFHTPPRGLTQVQVTLHISSLIELDSRNQRLTFSGHLGMVWFDERLRWEASQHGYIGSLLVSTDKVWSPEVTILNAVEATTMGRRGQLRVTSKGKMFWQAMRIFQTHCYLDMSYYPFDKQSCSVEISAWTYPKDVVNITDTAAKMKIQLNSGNEEWVFMDSALQEHHVTLRQDQEEYGALHYRLLLKRRPFFYVHNLIAVIIIHSLLTALVYMVPYESGQRVTYVTSVLVSFILLLNLISSKMPSTSRSTPLLSVYLVFNMLLQSGNVIMVLFGLIFFHHTEDPRAPRSLKRVAWAVSRLIGFDREIRVEELEWVDIARISDAFLLRLNLSLSGLGCLAFCLVVSIQGHLHQPQAQQMAQAVSN